MGKFVRPLLALALIAAALPAAHAEETGYANDSYAAQISFDAFNQSVKKRMQAARVGSSTAYFGAAPSLFRSDSAYAAVAPSSRSSSVAAGGSRRQLDCTYYNGFTIWGDLYGAWAKQTSRGGLTGYRYSVRGPAIGFDWSNSSFTFGVATTYNWGKARNNDFYHTRRTQTWAVELYGQYNTDRFYANATAAYSRTRFKGDRQDFGGGIYHNRNYSNAFNFDGEFGMKFGTELIKVMPNVGLRYFHDRDAPVSESGGVNRFIGDRRYYHVLELPVGVDLSSEIAVGGSLIVPRLRFAWIPELGRKRGNFAGADNGGNVSNDAPKRGRHGFQVGAGVEAKITRSISAHADYNVVFRRSAWEQRLNLGVGFTF